MTNNEIAIALTNATEIEKAEAATERAAKAMGR